MDDASTLLNTWTSILSQTEHNQRLILDPSWHGASQDIVNIEKESILKQQEKDRRDLEECRKRETLVKKAEEEERKGTENSGARVGKGTRVRGRGTSRGTSSDYVGFGGSRGTRNSIQPSVQVAERAGTGVGRGRGGLGAQSKGP